MKSWCSTIFIFLCFLNTAFAEATYQAKIEGASVTLSINDSDPKDYEMDVVIPLMADDLVCLHNGEGRVVFSGNDFDEQLSGQLQCQAIPKSQGKEGWFSKAKQPISEVGKEGMPADLASSNTTTSRISLGETEYFVLENGSWHKNRRTLPLSLQVYGSDGQIQQQYFSHQRKTSLFVVPTSKILGDSGKSRSLSVVNNVGSTMLEPTQFTLVDGEVNFVNNDSGSVQEVMQLQLNHLTQLLKKKMIDLGEHHPEVADVYVEIARVYTQAKNYSAAVVNLERALGIRAKTLGENSFVTAQTYNQLGEAYKQMGITPKAEENKNKALAIWKGEDGVSRGRGVRADATTKVFYDKDDHTIVEVIYGTDRLVNASFETGDSWEEYFTGDRSTLQYGLASVSIPKTHKVGEMERPGALSFTKETVGKHILITDLLRLEAQRFHEEIQSKLSNADENDILVFIHGYNVSFAGAVRSTAQLAYDLSFKGVPLTYSWPSKSETDSYLTDEASIQYTVPHLVKFLTEVIDSNQRSENPGNIHLVGHSMGTRALSYAVKELSYIYEGKPVFKNLIYAAPDIDMDVFEVSVFPYVKKTSEMVTLYANSDDVALQLSASLHGGQRLGQGGDGIFVFEGLDSIDASGVEEDLFSLSHSYFAEEELLINDFKDIIFKSLPPVKRKLLDKKSKDEKVYWAFDAK